LIDIPLCLIDRFEKGNFLAAPAIKVFLKNGDIQKIPFVDDSAKIVKNFTPDKFPCNQRKKNKVA
jgi:hypothetical protein